MGTRDRQPYLSATSLTQSLLDECQDNLEQRLEMIAEIETPGGTIYASDRNKYVGNRFYEALCTFPVISRTVGDWLSPEIQFSNLQISINNTDGRFNLYLPGGSSYNGFIGKAVTVKVGLGEVTATYQEIFSGHITETSGFSRDKSTFTLTARNEFDRANVEFPSTVLTQASFPDIEADKIGLGAPVIYGDWTVNLDAVKAGVLGFPVNGASASVLAGTTSLTVFISDIDISYVNSSAVKVIRGDKSATFAAADVTIGSGNRFVNLKQSGNGGITLLDGNPYIYESGDTFYIKVKGIDLGSYDDNIVSQGKDILKRFGGFVDGDFNANWDTYRDKSTPTVSAVANVKSRIWQQEGTPSMAYVASLFEQVRLEPFIDRTGKFKLSSLHFDDWASKYTTALVSGFKARNWDVKLETFSPKIDEINNWNRAKADYDRQPEGGEARLSTSVYRNSDAITQAGKDISKSIFFPNLYVESDVLNNLKEMLKLASAFSEFINLNLTSRAALLDIGDMIILRFEIGSTQFVDVPAIIREFGFDPSGLTIPVKLWSFQLIPFSGWEPSGSGIVGGDQIGIITEE